MKLTIAIAGFLVFFLNFLLSCQSNPFQQGEILYNNFCANCHMEDGAGLTGTIPPLAGADFVRDRQEELACIIRKGMEGEVVVNGVAYNQPMAGIPELTEFEIANVINYINQAWGNDYGYIKLQTIRDGLEKCD
jgi:mono/diheme cytochrome c family protein